MPRPLGPVGSGHASVSSEPAPATAATGIATALDRGAAQQPVLGDFQPAASFEQSFLVHHPIEAVWAFFGRLSEVVACLPGAALTGEPGAHPVLGTMRIKVGPLAAEFHGIAEVDRDDSTYSGAIRGSGRDIRTASATRGTIGYRLRPAGNRSTRVELTIGYTLTGPTWCTISPAGSSTRSSRGSRLACRVEPRRPQRADSTRSRWFSRLWRSGSGGGSAVSSAGVAAIVRADGAIEVSRGR